MTLDYHPSIARILATVAAHYDVPVIEIVSARQEEASCWARHVSVHLCRMLTPLSLTQIGEQIGRRTRATMLRSDHIVRDRLLSEPDVAVEIQQLRDRIVAHASPDTDLAEPVPDIAVGASANDVMRGAITNLENAIATLAKPPVADISSVLVTALGDLRRARQCISRAEGAIAESLAYWAEAARRLEANPTVFPILTLSDFHPHTDQPGDSHVDDRNRGPRSHL